MEEEGEELDDEEKEWLWKQRCHTALQRAEQVSVTKCVLPSRHIVVSAIELHGTEAPGWPSVNRATAAQWVVRNQEQKQKKGVEGRCAEEFPLVKRRPGSPHGRRTGSPHGSRLSQSRGSVANSVLSSGGFKSLFGHRDLMELELGLHRQKTRESPQGLFSRRPSEPALARFGSNAYARCYETVQLEEEEVRKLYLQKVEEIRSGLPRGLDDHRQSRPQSAGPSVVSGQSPRGSVDSDTNTSKRVKNENGAYLFDIYEGLRMLWLSIPPLPLGAPRPWPPKGGRRLVCNKDDCLKVYHKFVNLLALNGLDILADDSNRGSWPPPADDCEPSDRALSVLSWSTFLLWLEQTSQTTDSTRKRVAIRLQRALKRYLKSGSGPPCASLVVLMKWIWPHSTPSHIAKMFTWISLEELRKIELPPPPVIEESTRRHLQALYASMDEGNKGYLDANDIAGHDPFVIDAATVRCSIGKDRVDFNTFSELMVEDGYRGHEGQVRVRRPDGKFVDFVQHEIINFAGWFLVEPGAEEAKQQRRVTAFEGIVERWRRNDLTRFICGVPVRIRSKAISQGL